MWVNICKSHGCYGIVFHENLQLSSKKKSHDRVHHWTLKTGYFEDPTPAIQVQTLPLEGPRSLGCCEENTTERPQPVFVMFFVFLFEPIDPHKVWWETLDRRPRWLSYPVEWWQRETMFSFWEMRQFFQGLLLLVLGRIGTSLGITPSKTDPWLVGKRSHEWRFVHLLHLLETKIFAPENRPKPNRKGSYSNHTFSGAVLNFGGVFKNGNRLEPAI